MDQLTLTLSVEQVSWLYCLLFQVPAEYQNAKTEELKQKIEALPYPDRE